MLVKVGHLDGEVRTYDLADASTAGQLMGLLEAQIGCNVELVNCGQVVNASAVLGMRYEVWAKAARTFTT